MRGPVVALVIVLAVAVLPLGRDLAFRARTAPVADGIGVREATPAVLLARLAAADPDLRTYRADVAFELGLRTFPYLRKTVHGNAYFKRPARMELVFTDLPPYARSFSNLYVGLGTPSDWEKKFTITAADDPATREPYLVLTPRVTERRLREVDVYVDQAVPLPERIVWQYRDGRIEMHQHFGRIDGHDLVVGQDADIHFPAVHAYVRSRITNYALNVDVQDAVFTPKQQHDTTR
jgi:hypothetical protein